MLATSPTKQILIVDRDVAAVEPLRLRLTEVGFSVRAITNVSAAQSVLAERPPDLVIIDWNITGFLGARGGGKGGGGPALWSTRAYI